MAMVDQHSNSFGSYSSLVTDAYSKQFGSSATPTHPPEQWTDYSFLAFLGLAQRLHVDFLPITWQGSLGLLGRGGQAQVNQALINQAMGFAFKRFDHIRPQDPLRETVQEMLVLTHPLVRSHEHIVRLEGICWDIPQDDQVWPALVFEKTQFGDLHAFSKSKRFQAMAMGEKLELCADIGLAIRDMHYNGIIHGDIKPENVLVFEGAVQPLCARVGDFGYSTWFRGANDLILMPKSVPWCAPEHEGQKFHPLQAKQMDTYSFGMLCVWLLFEAGSSGSLPLHPDVVQGNDQCVTFEKPFPKNNLLDTWKSERSDMLVHWAQWLLLESTHFGGDMKDNLTQFFQSTLAMDPQERNTDFTELIFLLSPYRRFPQRVLFNNPHLRDEEEFQITTSACSFFLADFRLRLLIRKGLEAVSNRLSEPLVQHLSPRKAALQAALCYTIGFGVVRDQSRAERILSTTSLNHADLESLLQGLKGHIHMSFAQNNLYSRLHQAGYMHTTNFSQHYREKKLLPEAERTYKREIQDLQEVLGESNRLSLVLKSALAYMLSEEGRLEEAEAMTFEVMETQKRALGAEHPDTLTSMSNLGLAYQNKGCWEEAERLELLVKEARERLFGAEHPSTLNSIVKLGAIYRMQGRWKEAEILGVSVVDTLQRVLGMEHLEVLGSMATLASTYHSQGRWKDAEDLELQVVESFTRILGPEHPETLAIVSNLAMTYQSQGRLDDAERLDVQVMEARKRVLGSDHPDTIASMASLSNTWQDQGLWEQGLKLDTEIVELTKRKLGLEHPDTLASISNLAVTYFCLEKWNEAEELETQVLEVYSRVLGPEHPHTLSSTANLAATYRSQGPSRWKEGEKLELQVFETRKRVLGEDHPDTLTSMRNVAKMLMSQGAKGEAMSLMQTCMRFEERMLGFEHPDTQSSLEILNRWRTKDREDEV